MASFQRTSELKLYMNILSHPSRLQHVQSEFNRLFGKLLYVALLIVNNYFIMKLYKKELLSRRLRYFIALCTECGFATSVPLLFVTV